MRKSVTRHWLLIPAVSLIPVFATGAADAADRSIDLRISVGSSVQTRNDVQVPNTDAGTRFSLDDPADEASVTATRLELNWMYKERHGIRVLLAPLSYTRAVSFTDPVLFAGGSFAADQSLDATYKFNSWRLGYHYSMMQSDRGSFRIGATLKVRDAEIRLEQGNTVTFDDDVGLVPLLYLAGKYRLSNNWTIGADLDGLAGGPGRAIDLGVTLDYSITEHLKIGADLRVLDGGADVEDVYNFARFNSAALAVSASF